MNKLSKNLLVLFSVLIIGAGFNINLTHAQNNNLVLEVIKDCDIQFAGSSCITELALINNSGKILVGEAVLHISYKGQCSNNNLINFSGQGIQAQFSIIDNNFLNFSGWKNGKVVISNFNIPVTRTEPKLKIKTHPALCPGEYTFTLTLRGTAEDDREYVAQPIIMTWGGVPFVIPTPTTETGEVTATPDQGGITTFINPDGSKIRLFIPPTAVPRNTHFRIRPISPEAVNQPDPETRLFILNGLIFEITARRNGENITTFNRPLTLTFIYTDAQVQGLDENTLMIYYWDNRGRHIAINNSQVDINNNRVDAFINHFTFFALMGIRHGEVQGIAREMPEIMTEERRGTDIIERILSPVIPLVESIIEPNEANLPQEERIILGQEIMRTEERPGMELGLVAAMNVILEEIIQSPLLITITIIVVLSIIGLIIITGIEKYRLFRKRKNENNLRK